MSAREINAQDSQQSSAIFLEQYIIRIVIL